MATYDYLNQTGLGLVWQKVKTLLNGKVDKETGKVLSSNDFTDAYQTKLEGIAAGAEVNVNADWNSSSGDSQILNKPTIPSAGTGSSYPAMDGTRSLGSNSGYARVDHVHPKDTSKANLASPEFTGTPKAPTAASGTNTTQIATTAFVQAAVASGGVTVDTAMSDSSTNPVQNRVIKSYVDEAVSDITGVEFRVVSSLPSTGEAGVIYLVSNSGTGTNVYDEYIWVSNAFEKIGTTDVDLSGYVQATEMVAITEQEINQICV